MPQRSLRNMAFLFGYLGIVFVAVLAVLTLGLFWNVQDLAQIVSGRPERGQLVNLAGRQRMLSEKVVKEVLFSQIVPDPHQRLAALGRASSSFAELEAAHLQLRTAKWDSLLDSPGARASSGRAREIEAVLQEFRQEVSLAIGAGKTEPERGEGSVQRSRRLVAAADAYMVAMNSHLTQYVQVTADQERRATWETGLLLISSYLAIVALAWPIMRRARRSVQDLARAFREREAEREQRRLTQRQYDRLVMAMEQSPSAVLVCEADGAITYANGAIERICPDHSCPRYDAFKRLRVAGAAPVALDELCMIPPDVSHQLQSVIGTGRPWRSREPCGGECDGDMMVSASPILEPGGAVSGGVVLIRDFTHERQTEEFVRQSQKLESLGTLVGGVAHDFNNTLQVISGYLDLALREAEGNPQLQRDLGEAARAAQSGSAVTRQLLAFSRQGKLERHKADLNDLVSSHAQMVRRLLRRDIELIVARAPGPLPVDADAGSLEQVLLNLYLNAQDAMPAGGTLSVELERVTADEDFRLGRAWAQHPEYAVVRVRDTGIGMTKEVVARIFDPFFTTKPAGKGTGLGLTVAYGILRQHEGMIGVSSHPGDGTTIALYLPIGRPAGVEDAVPDAAPQARGTETILLIESDDAVRSLAASALKIYGFRVLTAGDGEAALRAVAAPDGQADLVVMDVHAPGLAGLRFYEQLIAQRPGLPVVATSGQISAEDSGELARRGVPLLKKPYSTAVLVGVLRQLLDLARSAPPARPLC